MLRRLIASFLIILAMVSFTTISYGASTSNKNLTPDITQYKVLNPEKSSFSTRNKVMLINGKAPTGTEINIDVYGTTDLTKKNFNLDKLPSEEDYINILSESVISGNLGFFQKELNLILGINKIIINFNVEGLEPLEFIVYCYEKAQSGINSGNNIKLSEILQK